MSRKTVTPLPTNKAIELAQRGQTQKDNIAHLATFLRIACRYPEHLATESATKRITEYNNPATLSLEISTLSTLLSFYLNARSTNKTCSTDDIKTDLLRIIPLFMEFFENSADSLAIDSLQHELKGNLTKNCFDALKTSGDDECFELFNRLLSQASSMTVFQYRAASALGYTKFTPTHKN